MATKKKIKSIKDAISEVKEDGMALEFLSNDLRSNFDVAMAAIKQNPEAFKFVGESLRGNKTIVYNSCHGYYEPRLFHLASIDLKKDKEFILHLIDDGYVSGGLLFEYIDNSLLNDKEFILEAMETCSCVLEYADLSLKSDSEFMKKAAAIRGFDALLNASESIKDFELCKIALEQDSQGFEYVPYPLDHNLELIFLALKGRGYNPFSNALPANNFSSKQKGDKNFMKKVIEINPDALKHASYALQADPDFVMHAINQKSGGSAIVHASSEIRNNKEFGLIAVSNDYNALKYLMPDLQKDKEVVIASVKYRNHSFEYAHPILKNDLNFVKEIVRIGGEKILEYVSSEIRENQEIKKLITK